LREFLKSGRLATRSETSENRCMVLRRLLWIAAAILFQAAGTPAPAQSIRAEDLEAGKFLVASKDLGDPNFAQTVVLLVKFDEDAVVGLIVNRPTRVPLSRIFGTLKLGRGRADPVYAGGPVGRTAALALMRTAAKVEGAGRVVGDVSLITGKAQLEKAITAGTEPSTLRVYMGYAGWTGPQLEHEVDIGGWYIFRGDPAMVFDADPESLWTRLIRKTEQAVAMNRAPQR
jgi:putative transcriptional regulator